LCHHTLFCSTHNYNFMHICVISLPPLVDYKYKGCLISMPSTAPDIHKLLVKCNWLKEGLNGSHGVFVRIKQNEIYKFLSCSGVNKYWCLPYPPAP
jgi:hypothetical protein